MAMGRPQRPYKTTWGELIPGLYKCPDGRWRINASGQKFTEHDERRAIEKFRTMAGAKPDLAPLVVGTVNDIAEVVPLMHSEAAKPWYRPVPCGDGTYVLEMLVDESIVWQYVGQELRKDPARVAAAVGIPELAGLSRFELPKPAARIGDVISAYKAHSAATEKSKNEALAAFDRLVKFTGARTLDELDESKLAAFREEIVNKSGLTSSATVSAYFSRCRNVLRLSGRGDIDAVQVDAALARMRAKLYPPASNVRDDPRPISKANFQKLLAHADELGNSVGRTWRAMLMVALNAALYMQDVVSLRWEHLDLEAGTYVARRQKRGKCIRCAVLWPETVQALRKITRTENPFVFISSHGTAYNKNTRINDFKDFANAAGVSDVTWSHLRDGAYTAACHHAPDERWARLLAGHAGHGLSDRYVVRTPQVVKPATDAVFAEYGPFGIENQ